ncbi:NAD(P)-binding domain-containing protein [Micromonospora carbonacea]|uniref:NAD(P)-binding domain-containing protein n=1 Tax=Micromonospora carbonacea TaxID=47853 RepID=A0A7H8XN12_9ACTN|nr:NAD(P)-binding domain-containing protein [Micromonospora carbonacea]MBB5826992.1 thioredoxin reductase [Micromonospora carbonacea]QLD25182.1 NAD(P)-binding domain-containing protein [Micromonospora carbonacea]
MTLDYLIIGAGPAGLQLAALLEADGRRDYLVLEGADSPGAFFATFPRHRQLISINKPHTGSDDPELNLRLDWNSLLSDDPTLRFTGYTERYFPHADVMVRYLADFAAKTGARVRYGARVTSVGRVDGVFEARTAGETFRARRLVVATGVSKPYEPPIPGLELAERYADMPVDPRDYLDQRVLIIGKGNSAFETAENLMETTTLIHVAGPSSVRMAWRTHYVGHLRAVNNNFLDTYQLKSANAILDGDVRRIERDGTGFTVTFSFSRANEVVKELRYDRVLACTGFAFDASIFDDTCRPALAVKGRFPAQTAAWESVDVPGLYFAGTLSQERDFKRSTNGFIHGFRYAVRALHKILERRYGDTPWPAEKLDATPKSIADAVVARVNRTSALWQQFGVLADVVTVAGPDARYHEEVPVDYFAEEGLRTPDHDYGHAFVVTLEYGPDHDQVDPFDITVNRVAQDVVGQAHDAAYLHPVVRHHRDGRVVATHHLAENLENRWDRPDVHVTPLVAFVDRCLSDVEG